METDRPRDEATESPAGSARQGAEPSPGSDDADGSAERLSEATSNGQPTVAAPSAEAEPADAAETTNDTRAPRRRTRPAHPQREDVPGLVLMWCLWLLGSWLIVRWQDGLSPAQMLGLGDYAGPPVTAMDLRWMILAAAAGLSGLWPAVRLSQVPRRGRALDALVQPLVDWLSLMIIWQAVLWPVYALVPWPVEQAVWLDVAVGGWALLMAAVIGWGRSGRSHGRRTLAMGACLALLLAEPAVLGLIQGSVHWLAGPGEAVSALVWTPRISPVPLLWALAAPTGYFEVDPWRWQALSLAGAAGLAWAALLGGAALRRVRR